MVKIFKHVCDENNFVREGNIIKGIEQKLDLSFYTGETILNTLKLKPDHVGQIEVETEKQSTYAEMKDKSVRCAIWMTKYGIESGDIIVTCSHNHLDAYVPVFATFYLGAVQNPWSPDTNIDLARYLLKLLTPKLLFTCESSADILLEAAKLENVNTKFIVFGTHSNVQSLDHILELQTKDEVEKFVPRKIENPKALAVIIWSSGSTGVPKGIMFSHESFIKNTYTVELCNTSCTIMWYSALYWMTGIILTLNTLFNYGTRIIHVRSNAEETCKIIEKYQVNTVFSVPSLLTLLDRSDAIDKYDLSSLENISFGGFKPYKEVLKILKKRIPSATLTQVYGMTEFGRNVAHQYSKYKSIDSIGFIDKDTEIKITDLKTGKNLGPNEIGELLVKSSSMMLGYYKNPEATNQAFDEEGWLCSGDLGYYDEDCEIFLIDRISELIKYRNYLLRPNEIEEVLMTNRAVMEVAVIALPHEKDGEWPMAFVKIADDSNVSEKELIELSSTLGEEKKIRGGIVFLKDIPKTASTKIARHELKLIAKNLAHKKIENNELFGRQI